MKVAVDLGSAAVKVADGPSDADVSAMAPADPEVTSRMGAAPDLIRRDGALVTAQAPHNAYVRAVSVSLGERAAESVAVVTPDWWSDGARALLTRTLEAHASGPIRVVSTAEAAVHAVANRDVLPNTVAVLDLGAESSTAAVVSEFGGRYRITGRPAVLHGKAGNDLDRRLMQLVLGWLAADGFAPDPYDLEAVTLGHALLVQIRRAKEDLTRRQSTSMRVRTPSGETEVRLVRSEFDEVARATLHTVISMLRSCIESSVADGVGAVLLVGGSSSIPLLTQLISAELGLPVILDQDPATLAVRGATMTESPAAQPRQRRWMGRREGKATSRPILPLSDAPQPSAAPVGMVVGGTEDVVEDHSGEGVLRPEDVAQISNEAKDADARHRRGRGEPTDERASDAALVEPPVVSPVPELENDDEELAPDELHPEEPADLPIADSEPAEYDEPTAAASFDSDLDIVVERGRGASAWRGPEARWASNLDALSSSRMRSGSVDDHGRLVIRINGQEHAIVLEPKYAAKPVVLLVERLHVLIAGYGTGELIRELQLDPNDGFRPA